MSDRDPRIRGLFGAAWLVGYLAHAAAAGVRSVGVGAACPGARVRPLALAVAATAGLGAPVRVAAPMRAGDPAVIAGPGGALIANTAAQARPVTGLRVTAARVLDATALPDALTDPGWLSGAPAQVGGTLTLPPYAVAMAHLEDA